MCEFLSSGGKQDSYDLGIRAVGAGTDVSMRLLFRLLSDSAVEPGRPCLQRLAST